MFQRKEISVFGFYGDVTFMLVSMLAMIGYWHMTRTFKHWRDKGVFYLEPTVLFGNLKDRILFRISFPEFQLQLYDKFAGRDYGGFFEGRRPTLLLRDPELIKHVMVKDFEHFVDRPSLNFRTKAYDQSMLLMLKGARWKSVRALMTPTFSSSKLRVMEELVVECAVQMREYLTHRDDLDDVEMKEMFGRYTLEVIARCAFGVRGDSLQDSEAEFVKVAAQFNDLSLLQRSLIFAVILIAPGAAKYMPLSFFNTATMDYLADLVKEAMRRRREEPESRRQDFVQLMLDAAAKEEAEDGTTRVLDEDTIVSQSLLFLIAGFETSSTLLTFVTYELALNPDVQERLREEICHVLARHDNAWSREAVQEMSYLEQVLLETLRLHPPVSRVDRLCTAAYTLPGTSVRIDPGMSVGIPIFGLHMDEKYYPDPTRFDPARFEPEEKAKRSPFVYLPFGGGPRNCLGLRFAMTTAKMAVIALLSDYYVTTCARTQVPFVYDKKSMLLKAQDGIHLALKRVDYKKT